MRKGRSQGLRERPKAFEAPDKAVSRRRDRREGGVRKEFVEAVMAAAKQAGLVADKSRRITARVSPELIERAKRRTGIAADSELIAFALANFALEDEFPEASRKARGTVDPDLKLGH